MASNLLFSPDGKWLLCNWTEAQNKVGSRSLSNRWSNRWAMWDINKGKIVRKWPGSEWQEAFFVPQGLSFVTAKENTLILSEASSGRMKAKFKISGQKAEMFALAPDGKLLASSSSDGVLHVWNAH